MDELEAIQQERQGVYGPWEPNMRATSMHIEALRIQWESNNPGRPFPEWWAPLVQVVVKVSRIASGHYHADNFQDIRNYLGFVEDMQSGDGQTQGPSLELTEYVPPCDPPDGFEWAGEFRAPRRGEFYWHPGSSWICATNDHLWSNRLHIIRRKEPVNA